MVKRMTSLNHLVEGQQAIIAGVHADEALFQRMAALGLRSGKQVKVVRKASFNGPMHIRIGTTDIMLRLSDASRISILSQ